MLINKKLKNLALLSMGLSILSSCATIVNGSHQSIGIVSQPSNAAVWVDRTYVGTTPLIVEMSRKDQHFVQIALDGFEPYEVTFSRRLSGWVFGNIVFGGFIGLAVDAISGGLYMLTPEQLQVELQSQQLIHTAKSDTSCVLIVLKPHAEWQKVGNLIASH